MHRHRFSVFVLLACFVFGCGKQPDSNATPANGDAPPPAKGQTPPPGEGAGPKTGLESNTPPAPKATSTEDKGKVKVEISKAALKINGAAVPLPGVLAAFEKAFGKPTSTNDRGGVFRALYWQPLGIKSLQEKSGEQRLVTLQFHLEKYDDVFDNVKCEPFPGTILLEGEPITKETDLDETGKKISGLKKTLVKWELSYPDAGVVYIDTSLNFGPKGKLLKGVRELTFEKLK